MSNTPDHTAVRTALWRALHAKIDANPVFKDEVGARIIGEPDWEKRGDMAPDFSKSMRASIATRARFVEDLVEQERPPQYVILGAGLDTFALRRPEFAGQIFEVDQSGPQAWKRERMQAAGLATPTQLHFVPVNFEQQSWWTELTKAGFDKTKPALFSSTGVSLYLSREANAKTLEQIAKLAPGSTFAMTFMLSLDLLPPQERAIMEFVMKRAAEGGTPFLSLFRPDDLVAMARDAGFKDARYVSAQDLFARYLANRKDGLNAGSAEAFLIATT